jgi:beta-hydroxylase
VFFEAFMLYIVSILSVYVLSFIYVRVRNKELFSFRRQMTDVATFMMPFNLPAYLLSKIPLRSHYQAEQFPELQLIEDNWEDIRDEALTLYKEGHITVKDDLPASSFYKDNRWTSFYLKLYDSDIPSAYALAPKTMALIEQVPSMNLALFACLNPGKQINNHHDPFAYTLRYSMGLSTPNSDDSGIVVNGEDHKWRDGESVIFDETYLHHAYNNTDKPRIILMTDIDRPLKIKFIQRLYFYFGRFFNNLFAIDNIDSKKSGIGNKFGYYFLAYKKFIKRIKHWNKPIYMLGKYALTFGFLYYIGLKLI